MAVDESRAGLGLFVVIGVAVMLTTTLFFIQRLRQRAVIPLVTYVTENVSGLDISSPVRYRGVAVGRVTDLRFDPTENAIEVDFAIFQDRLATIGANVARVRELAELDVAPRLRARVVGNPITGDGYLLLDAPSNPPPPPSLGFTPKPHYVPSMPSTLSAVQDRLPEVLERAQAVLETLRVIADKIPGSIDRTDRFLSDVDRMVRETELPALSADLRGFSRTAGDDLARMRSDMDRVMGDEGTLVQFAEEARSALRDADVPESSKAARDAAERTSLAADEVRRSLPAMRETLEQLHELSRRLAEQPESVVYGPRQAKSKSK